MEIVQLASDDWELYRDLRLRAVEDNPQSFLSTPDEVMAKEEKVWREQLANMWFAVVGGKLVGMIGAIRTGRAKDNHFFDVVSFFVLPEFRGKGVGRALLKHVIELAKANPEIVKLRLGVTTTQTGAIELYKSLGFEKIGHSKMSCKVGDEFFDEDFMELYL